MSISISIPEWECTFQATHSSGPGGQNVNKVATAILLRWDIHKSSLEDFYKRRILRYADHRIQKDGSILIKAQNHRTQEANKLEAIKRLQELVQKACTIPKKRKPTQRTKASKRRRVDKKVQRGQIKSLRGKVNLD